MLFSMKQPLVVPRDLRVGQIITTNEDRERQLSFLEEHQDSGGDGGCGW
jgi:hypothetical protein